MIWRGDGPVRIEFMDDVSIKISLAQNLHLSKHRVTHF